MGHASGHIPCGGHSDIWCLRELGVMGDLCAGGAVRGAGAEVVQVRIAEAVDGVAWGMPRGIYHAEGVVIFGVCGGWVSWGTCARGLLFGGRGWGGPS